jgi:hypothetical protein
LFIISASSINEDFPLFRKSASAIMKDFSFSFFPVEDFRKSASALKEDFFFLFFSVEEFRISASTIKEDFPLFIGFLLSGPFRGFEDILFTLTDGGGFAFGCCYKFLSSIYLVNLSISSGFLADPNFLWPKRLKYPRSIILLVLRVFSRP